MTGMHLPTGALVRNFSITKLHVHQDEYEVQRDMNMNRNMKLMDKTEIYDALMCMGLVGPFAHQGVASWISPPRWMPLNHGGTFLSDIEGSYSSQSFPEDACAVASSLFEAFCACLSSYRRDCVWQCNGLIARCVATHRVMLLMLL